MRIKELTLNRAGLLLKLSKSDLKSLDDEVRRTFKPYRKDFGSTLYVNSSLNKSNYRLNLSFKPSIKLDRLSIFRLMKIANKATGLNFNIEGDSWEGSRDGLTVTPSGLRYFREPWSNMSVGVGDSVSDKNAYVARIDAVGNPEDSQFDKLKSMVDEVHLPMQNGNGWLTDINENFSFDYYCSADELRTGNGTYPRFTVDKIFYGEFGKETEKKVVKFYNEFRKFIVEEKICEDCLGIDGRPLSQDLKEELMDLRKETRSAHPLSKKSCLSPDISVIASVPLIGERSEERKRRGIPEPLDGLDFMNVQY